MVPDDEIHPRFRFVYTLDSPLNIAPHRFWYSLGNCYDIKADILLKDNTQPLLIKYSEQTRICYNPRANTGIQRPILISSCGLPIFNPSRVYLSGIPEFQQSSVANIRVTFLHDILGIPIRTPIPMNTELLNGDKAI